MMRIPGRNLALFLTAAVLFAACGSRSSEGTAGQAPNKTVTRKAAKLGDELSLNMVSAVAANKPSTLPVQVKFELRDRPDVGQPVGVELAIVPMSASVDRLSGKVEGEDGLELLDGAQIAATDRPVEGVPIRHAVKVVARREGIFTVHAVLTVDSSGQTSTETYAMPVIAGGGDPGPAKPATGVPATAAVAAAASPAAAH
jgi:hypothetical protein